MSGLGRLAFAIERRPGTVIATALVVMAIGITLTPRFQSQLLGVGYETSGTDSHAASRVISDATGYTERDLLVVSSERFVWTDDRFREAMQRAIGAVRSHERELLVLPPGAEGGGTVSSDGRVATAIVGLIGEASVRQETVTALQDVVADAVPAGFEAGITGNSPLIADLIHVEERDLLRAELVGLPVATAVLLAAFGSVLAAGLPLLLAISGLFVSIGLISGLMAVMDFNAFAETLMVMIGLAIGIDYSLLLVRRFREERARSGVPGTAMSRTLSTAGKTILFSGAILATSLTPLVVARVPFFSDIAVAVMVVVGVEVVLTLTLLPAVLIKLGDRIDLWSLPWQWRRARAGGERSGWYRWAQRMMRRPWPVLAAGSAVLLLAAVPLLDIRTGIDLNARAMEGEPSVRPLTTLREHFPNAALGPVEVVVRSDPAGLAPASERAAQILRGEQRLVDLSLAPLDEDAALLVATPTVAVDSPAAFDLVSDLRSELAAAMPAGSDALVSGVTAEIVDYGDVTERLTPWVVGAALALALVLLTWLFRSPVLALKAIVLNLLSIGAALGLTVLVFQEGHGEDLFGFTSPGYIQSWTPLTMFVMLFGLSMDYEVFMVTRIREEWERSGDTREAVATGLQRTGGVVTAAAAIMVAIFASFILASIPEIKQMGFGLAVAVLLDATLVRAVLVPAFFAAAGRWNWWLPRQLDRLLPKLEH